MVGLGLGVWQVAPAQAVWFLEAYPFPSLLPLLPSPSILIYGRFAEVLSDSEWDSISDVNFSWFPPEAAPESPLSNGMKYKCRNDHVITIWFSKRDPAEKLAGG